LAKHLSGIFADCIILGEYYIFQFYQIIVNICFKT
jgi:hypothetical protein